MTGPQKAIKVLSIIIVIVGILALIAGLTTCAGSAALVGAGAEASAADQDMYALGAGMFMVLAAGAIITGILNLIIGICGIRGAKDPNKIMPFFVFTIIGLVIAAVGLISYLASGVNDPTTLVSNVVEVVLMAVCVYLANEVKKLRS